MHASSARAIAVLLLAVTTVFAASAAPQDGSRLIRRNGRPVREMVTNIHSLRLLTYYDDGAVKSDSEWVNGRRNGLTRVYLRDNVLLKEMRFRDNYLVEYTAYKDGRVETRISADRSVVINKGRSIDAKWDKLYEVHSDGSIWVFSRKSLLDWMATWLVPEDMAQKFADISDHFDALTGAAGAGAGAGNDLITCNGTTSLGNDFGMDITTLGSSGSGRRGGGAASGLLAPGAGAVTGRPGSPAGGRLGSSTPRLPSAMDAAAGILDTCSGSTGGAAGVTGIGGGGGTGTERQKHIDKARQSLDDAIAECEARDEASGGGMFATELPPFKSIAILDKVVAAAEYGTTVIEAAATETAVITTETAVVEKTIIDAAVVATEGSAVSSGAGTAIRGFVLGEVAVATAAVAVAAGVGFVIGTALSESEYGQAFMEWVAKLQESGDASYQQAVAEAAAAQKEAEERRRNEENARKAAEEAAASSAPGGEGEAGQPGVSMPLPDDLGSGSVCDRMRAFKDYCDQTDWRDPRCESYIRFVRGCLGDITRMYVAGDGNIYDVGCSNGDDPAEFAAKQDCKRKGMVAIPSPEGGMLCRTGRADLVTSIRIDPRNTDPVRIDYHDLFAGTGIEVIRENSIDDALGSKTPTMIVFMDLGCSSCQEFSETLLDPRVEGNPVVDIRVVDAGEYPHLISRFGITYFPSYFLAKEGKQTRIAAGAMTPQETLVFLRQSLKDRQLH